MNERPRKPLGRGGGKEVLPEPRSEEARPPVSFDGVAYRRWFRGTAGFEPHRWQEQLAGEAECRDRLLRVPTGFGKTLGVLGAWLYRRAVLADDAWPRRVVWCLPMRVLVEQTEAEVKAALERVGLLWEPSPGDREPYRARSHEGKVGVHLLMGGADADEWHLYPEHYAILVGTQDMLLSRALNRGYGAARARWPMDFGLLGQDCLWVLDAERLPALYPYAPKHLLLEHELVDLFDTTPDLSGADVDEARSRCCE